MRAIDFAKEELALKKYHRSRKRIIDESFASIRRDKIDRVYSTHKNVDVTQFITPSLFPTRLPFMAWIQVLQDA